MDRGVAVLAYWLGIDTGGTFTDFVCFNGHSLRTCKVLSTPDAPERAILQGIEALQLLDQLQKGDLQIIHGSTVATNALLQARGVKTVYVTNRGFADVLSIGRQARRELYNLIPEPCAALIPAAHCLEVNTRLSSEGVLLTPLDPADVDALICEIKKIKPRAVAINLLFSFLDNRQEQAIKARICAACEGVFVTCSSDVLPEYKEYERGMATALNAYVGPLMQGYLNRLSHHLVALSAEENTATSGRIFLSILQSSGGTIDAQSAGEHAVKLLLSGPAGGLKGAQYIAALAGESTLLSFDMGGTSTDVAMIHGEIQLTSEGSIGDYPVAVPMVDMHTIGAGGGSIAYVDAGGLLNVGPQSAGASPGPACYGQGGKKPTVTDANLILGRLQVAGFAVSEEDAGSGLSLDIDGAIESMKRVAEPLGISVEAAAQGVIRIANEHMVRALRTISVQRGYDPQAFSLTCLGGAAGLHVCALAQALNMHKAIVPVHGGVLSALGMLVAAPSRELSLACLQPLLACEPAVLDGQFNELQNRAVQAMGQEIKVPPVIQRSVDLRYKGQSFTLNLNWEENLQKLQQAFHQLHETTYGHQLTMPVELVNLRMSVQGEAPPFSLPFISHQRVVHEEKWVNCYTGGMDVSSQPVRLYQREQLSCAEKITGPALVLEKNSTTLIEPGWCCVVDGWGNLLLKKVVSL
ncbi:N-methylhydantoinase A [hydrothermal vent metagenome]|uniref:N-methylhydantoinase A n=1 Tax=hydrothermal vent metagenome TaxID=652676 RepID=A0A3B0YV35_9ZZZZ